MATMSNPMKLLLELLWVKLSWVELRWVLTKSFNRGQNIPTRLFFAKTFLLKWNLPCNPAIRCNNYQLWYWFGELSALHQSIELSYMKSIRCTIRFKISCDKMCSKCTICYVHYQVYYQLGVLSRTLHNSQEEGTQMGYQPTDGLLSSPQTGYFIWGSK